MDINSIKRPIDPNGRIVLPKHFVQALKMDKSKLVSISVSENKLIIERADTVCDYCDSKEIHSEEYPICKNCAKKLKA